MYWMSRTRLSAAKHIISGFLTRIAKQASIINNRAGKAELITMGKGWACGNNQVWGITPDLTNRYCAWGRHGLTRGFRKWCSGLLLNKCFVGKWMSGYWKCGWEWLFRGVQRKEQFRGICREAASLENNISTWGRSKGWTALGPRGKRRGWSTQRRRRI